MGITNPHMDPNWLKTELEKPGRSQSGLARFMGFEYPSVINRMCRGERQIKASEADKIRTYLAATERGGGATLARIAPQPQAVSLLQVRGTVEAGSWREVGLADLGEDAEVLVAPQSYADEGAYALRVAGPSMNLFYPEGTFIVVRPFTGGLLPFGKRMVIERNRDGLIETTVKELVRGENDEPELWPRSNHPAHQKPLAYKEDDATLRLLATVIASIRPE